MERGTFQRLSLSFLLILQLVAAVFGDQNSTSPRIILPANGTSIQPGETFPFAYQSIGQDGVTSYLCTCWFFTEPAKGFVVTNDFARGHFIGAFVLEDSPPLDNNSNYRKLPDSLTMPDFSRLSAGYGVGEIAQDAVVYLGVIEEYGTSEPSFGSRMSFALTQVTYNSTSVNNS